MTASLRLLAFMAYCLTLLACKKEILSNPSPPSDTDYLLSRVVVDNDTVLYADYNIKNQLVNFTTGLTTCDSLSYDSNGNLASCRQIVNNAISATYYTSYFYRKDTIEVISKSGSYGRCRKYTLENGTIVKRQGGFVIAGVPRYSDSDTISYQYSNRNLVKCTFPLKTSSYQPIDTFAYGDSYNNPYQTLGEHLYLLITDDFSKASSESVLASESKNMPTLESYATYSISNNDLTSSGFSTHINHLMQVFEANNALPAVVKTTDSNGVERTLRFVYVKKRF